MKKILAIALAVAMIASVAMLAGCGSKTADTASKADADAANNETAKEKLTMATNASFPPYEYKEDGETIIGIDAEIAQAIADKLNMELEIVDIDFGAIIAGVQSGKYSMGMAGMTVTEERLQSVDFSSTYATGVQVIIVKEGSAIKSFDDIAAGEYKVGVQLSTTGDIYASEDLADTKSEVVEYETGNDAVTALVSGKVDAVIIDNEPAKAYVAANEGLTILDTDYVTEDYAICFAKNNTELKDKVNGALEALIADGTVKKIIDKYITAK
ncbi:MAG: transporter substrate-binding domain-containing protein [Ruminococcus sp.]|nr:transporter substrate-binding domain-containing protein [Ruminococcus sp.]